MVASTVSYVERDEQQTVPEIVSTGELILPQLASHDFALVPHDARSYFRDVSDLVQEVRENIHIMEDQLTNILQAAFALGVRLLRADGGQRNPHAGAVPDLSADPLAVTTQKSLQSAPEAKTCND